MAKPIALLPLILLLACGQPRKSTVIPPPDPDNGGLVLPGGFGALIVADSVGPSRHLAVSDNGDIYVKLSISKGDKGNVAMRDSNEDGKADIIERWGDYPNDGSFATEMRIHKDYIYFSSELVVYRQKLTPPDLVPSSELEVIMRDRYPIRWHNAKSLAFDNEGHMFVTFSAPTNNCEDWNSVAGNPNVAGVQGFYPCLELEEMGGIWKMSEDRLEQYQYDGQHFATGLRSVVAIAWNHDDNRLYAVLHGRDYLYNHAPVHYSQWQNAVLPAEEFMVIGENDNYGWPYSYYDHFKKKRMVAPEYGGDGKQESNGYTDPLMGLPAHWAPNDLLFYKGEQFPPRYRKGAFVAFHGSTNRGPYPQAGYIVGFIPFKEGKPSGEWEVFADGFAGVDTIRYMKDAKYRPVGLAEGPDGSLYVSDSKKGRIWRIIFNGNASAFGEAELAGMEARKSRTYIKTPDEKMDLLKTDLVVEEK